MAEMILTGVSICSACGGTGKNLTSTSDEGVVTIVEVSCESCSGSGKVGQYTIDISTLYTEVLDCADKVDDCLDKLNDIKEILDTM